ncbi:MAG: Fe-S cluster assembly protein HesB [Actinomycetota bacterium]|nr:Fe-S cluster assembly protein HesB [Actinomycetota bacterium]
MTAPAIRVTDEDADRLVSEDPLALLIGMLLDQQVPMEWAFRGPLRLRERLGVLDATGIAALSPGELETAFRQPPALHRFPAAMARRTQALCRHLIEHYDGHAARVWSDVDDAWALLGRLRALPGYGDEKARIFLAVLAKRLGVRPAGWEEAAGRFSDDVPRSVADVDSPEALQRRAFKRAQRATGKGKGDAVAPDPPRPS